MARKMLQKINAFPCAPHHVDCLWRIASWLNAAVAVASMYYERYVHRPGSVEHGGIPLI
jgi:hypothetical protein